MSLLRRPFEIFPERWVIGLIGLVVGVLILLIGGYTLTVYEEQTFRTQKIREVTVQANILAESVAASLVFLDPEATQAYLNSLMVNPEIEAAAVYDEAGKMVAEYIRTNDDFAPGAAPPTTIIERRVINIAQPVVRPTGKVGTVALRVLVEPLGARLQGYTGLILALCLSALLFGVLISGLVVLARTNAKFHSEMVRREHAEEALRHSQKMESIGQLAGGIAHDFNNALAIVIGSLGLLRLRSERGDKNLEQYVKRALEGANRAATLTQRLLAFSHRQPLKPQHIDVNQLVERMCQLLRGTIDETTHIQTILGEDVWHIQADPSELENVIVNLAINGRDAMPEGGKLTIKTANAYLDESHTADDPEIKPGQYARISVTDTGTGMAAEIAAKAFDPFFTTKSVGKGTGLGLSQVYGFVKQSGGYVRIHSEVGSGTTVNIYLPRSTSGPANKSETITADIVKTTESHTILVVDDDGAVRKLAVDLLRELGYRVLHADSAAEALRVLQNHNNVDLLFTDVVMPEVDGRKLVEEARLLRPDLKILYTTGYTNNVVGHDGTLDQGMHFLNKPFTVEQLSLHVRDALLENVSVRT